MADKSYTIKELADKVHVTKPAIRKLMNSSFRKQHTSVSGNRILIDNDGAQEIINHFENSTSESNQKPKTDTENQQAETKTKNQEEPHHHNKSDGNNELIKAKDDLINELRDQLKAKDHQITDLHKLMDQNQQLLLHTQEENKQLLSLTYDDSFSKETDNVREAEYKESQPDQKPETETENQVTEKHDKKRHWWNLFS